MPTRYKIQLYWFNPGTKQHELADIHPTNGPAYTYDSYDEAEHMLRLCYPDSFLTESERAKLRVIEVGA